MRRLPGSLSSLRVRDGTTRAINAHRHDPDAGRSGRRRALELSAVRPEHVSLAARLVRDRVRVPLLVHVQARLAAARGGDRRPQGANRARPRRRDRDAAASRRRRGRARKDVGRGAREGADRRPGRARRRRRRRPGRSARCSRTSSRPSSPPPSARSRRRAAEAMANVAEVAREAAAAIVERLAGRPADPAAVAAAVNSVKSLSGAA